MARRAPGNPRRRPPAARHRAHGAGGRRARRMAGGAHLSGLRLAVLARLGARGLRRPPPELRRLSRAAPASAASAGQPAAGPARRRRRPPLRAAVHRRPAGARRRGLAPRSPRRRSARRRRGGRPRRLAAGHPAARRPGLSRHPVLRAGRLGDRARGRAAAARSAGMDPAGARGPAATGGVVARRRLRRLAGMGPDCLHPARDTMAAGSRARARADRPAAVGAERRRRHWRPAVLAAPHRRAGRRAAPRGAAQPPSVAAPVAAGRARQAARAGGRPGGRVAGGPLSAQRAGGPERRGGPHVLHVSGDRLRRPRDGLPLPAGDRTRRLAAGGVRARRLDAAAEQLAVAAALGGAGRRRVSAGGGLDVRAPELRRHPQRPARAPGGARRPARGADRPGGRGGAPLRAGHGAQPQADPRGAVGARPSGRRGARPLGPLARPPARGRGGGDRDGDRGAPGAQRLRGGHRRHADPRRTGELPAAGGEPSLRRLGRVCLMCGIAGLLSLDGARRPDPGELGAMGAALAHRGPDGGGELRDGPLALAIRRLAIVDAAGGHQPLASEDGAVQVVCNGEIYNARTLRRDLERRGHRFKTRSDVEVIVHLYEESGTGCLDALRGMFALALWDARERRLVLARDPFGIKPLVYALAPGRLAFASELKALLTLPWLSREIDLEALECFLAVNSVLAPRTIFRAARKLPPGHLLIAAAGAVRVERWARPRPVAAGAVRRETPAELAAEARERLRDSVRAHLEADVEVGVLLSGGVDSGTVAALAAAELARPLKTFSVGFTERSFDELGAAGQVARRYGTDHRELVVGPDAAADLHAVAATFDEPRGDSTALPYWLACRLAATEVKAVLSGEGSDELFGGYQTYVAGRLAALARPLAAAEPLLARWPSSSRRLSLEFKLRRLARGAGLAPVERHHAYKEIFSAAARAELLRPERRGAADPLDAYRSRYAETAGAEPVARLQDLDVGTFLADDLLAQTDRAGMAHGLEVRVPYLDPVVAELAHALPVEARVRGLQTKPLLRAAAAPLLPGTIVRGPKRGFCAPAAAWLRGPLLPLARELLAPARIRAQGLFEPAAVTALLERHVARREDASRPLWALIAFGLWHEAHVAAPRTSMEGIDSARVAA